MRWLPRLVLEGRVAGKPTATLISLVRPAAAAGGVVAYDVEDGDVGAGVGEGLGDGNGTGECGVAW